jgi:hypothetical protein
MASPLDLVVVPVVIYEYLFYLLLSERLRPPARRKGRGYYQGLIPRVPHVIGYGQKIWI